MGHQRCHGTRDVHRAQRRREVRHPATGVRGAVERVDDHHDGSIEVLGSALLRQDPASGRAKARQHLVIGHQIGGVLAVAQTRRTPIGHGREPAPNRVGDLMEQLQQGLRRHGVESSVV